MEPTIPSLVIIGGFLLGLAFGATVHRTHFCTMGAIADIALFGDWRRMRAWLLAIATALIGTQALQLAGLIDLRASFYVATAWPWFAVIVGGLMFGFGMTQTGGCASRNLARLGGGNLKSLVVLVVMALVASATLALVLPPFRGLQVPALAGQGTLGGLLAPLGLARPVADALLAALIGGGLLLFCLRDSAFRRARREIAAGIILGVLATLGWLITASAGEGFAARASLNFVLPLAAGGLAVLGLPAGGAGFGLALIAGAVVGAFAMAQASGTFRIERFAGAADRRRHLAGAALMGAGGGLALGCTIGHGLSGVSSLALTSILAFFAIAAGGIAGVRYLEQGSLRGAVRALLAGG
jgi:uncharacterized membrane protein YedE/YeeE